ncbi:MAG: DUF1622 domain-containing protein [Nitrospirota bacterium]|nr:DUF1622 domain-containing protein [Nitrospirota bacterium]
MTMDTLQQFFEYVALAIDLVGISIILWGFSLSFKDFVALELTPGKKGNFIQVTQQIRCQLGTYLLMGLEFMIASDIIHSFITRSTDDLIYLGVIVVIRTAIGYFLGKELAEAHQHH